MYDGDVIDPWLLFVGFGNAPTKVTSQTSQEKILGGGIIFIGKPKLHRKVVCYNF